MERRADACETQAAGAATPGRAATWNSDPEQSRGAPADDAGRAAARRGTLVGRARRVRCGRLVARVDGRSHPARSGAVPPRASDEAVALLRRTVDACRATASLHPLLDFGLQHPGKALHETERRATCSSACGNAWHCAEPRPTRRSRGRASRSRWCADGSRPAASATCRDRRVPITTRRSADARDRATPAGDNHDMTTIRPIRPTGSTR